MAPDYISRLLDVRQHTRYSLRSSSSIVLNYPKGRMLSSFGDRSFSVASPKLWNSLPANLRFKAQLKKIFLPQLLTDIYDQ